MIHETYINKETRENRYKDLKSRGYNVIKTSSSNQYCHPQYVNDYPYELSESDKGFGNTLYKTYFKKLYHLEIRS